MVRQQGWAPNDRMTSTDLDALARIQLLQQHLIEAMLHELGADAATRVESALAGHAVRIAASATPEVDEVVSAWLVQTLSALDRQA